MEIYGYIAAVFMGLSLGMIGGGGSILTVPILVYLFAIHPVVATSTSLFVVGSVALVGAILCYRRKEVDLKVAVDFALPSFAGVFIIKALVLPKIPNQIMSFNGLVLTKSLLLMGVFAILMVLASYSMIRKKKAASEMSAGTKDWKSIATQGLLVGSVTGLVGAGGGFLIVPALVNLVGLQMRIAIGTSLSIIAANSLFGFSVALVKGLEVNWNILLSVLAVALVGLVAGTSLSAKVSEQKLKKGFGYFVLIMGTIILIDQIRKL